MTISGASGSRQRVARARKPWKAYGRYGSVGLELLLSIAVGYYLGRWLDGRFFGGRGWATGVGFLLGVYTGFRALFVTAKKMQKDVEEAEALDRGEDPWDDEEQRRNGDEK